MKFYENDQNRCAIILAGGDGRRLSEVTRRITGDATPKQFCPVIGSTPLVGQTCLRVSLAIDEDRIFAVVTRAHERHYRDLLKDILPENLVIQPENRGTAPAILYALLRLYKAAPDACVGGVSVGSFRER